MHRDKCLQGAFLLFYIFSVICFVSSESLFYDSIGKILILLLMRCTVTLQIGFSSECSGFLCGVENAICTHWFVTQILRNLAVLLWLKPRKYAELCKHRGFCDNVSETLQILWQYRVLCKRNPTNPLTIVMEVVKKLKFPRTPLKNDF